MRKGRNLNVPALANGNRGLRPKHARCTQVFLEHLLPLILLLDHSLSRLRSHMQGGGTETRDARSDRAEQRFAS